MDKLACFTVVKPQGIKGELKARILADDIYSVMQIKTLYDEAGNEYKVKKVKDAFGGFAFLSLDKIVTRNDAELYRNVTFYAPKSSIVKEKNDYFISDIIGLDFVVDGEVLGSVSDVIKSNVDMFEIIYKNGKKAYFPHLIALDIKIDLESKTLSVASEKLDGVIYYED